MVNSRLIYEVFNFERGLDYQIYKPRAVRKYGIDEIERRLRDRTIRFTRVEFRDMSASERIVVPIGQTQIGRQHPCFGRDRREQDLYELVFRKLREFVEDGNRTHKFAPDRFPYQSVTYDLDYLVISAAHIGEILQRLETGRIVETIPAVLFRVWDREWFQDLVGRFQVALWIDRGTISAEVIPGELGYPKLKLREFRGQFEPQEFGKDVLRIKPRRVPVWLFAAPAMAEQRG